MIQTTIPILSVSLEYPIDGILLQNQAESIALDAYILKTCPDIKTRALGGENESQTRKRKHVFFHTSSANTTYQVVDSSELTGVSSFAYKVVRNG